MLGIRKRAVVVAAVAAVAVGGVTVPVSSASAATPDPCKHVLGNSVEGYVHGTHVGTFYEAWNSCTSQVYAEFHFASTTQARAFDGSSVIGIMHSGHDYPWALNRNGGSVWWESQFPSIYSDPRSDRRYDAYITITNNGITVCTGWAGWDFSGHQIAPTWISCG